MEVVILKICRVLRHQQHPSAAPLFSSNSYTMLLSETSVIVSMNNHQQYPYINIHQHQHHQHRTSSSAYVILILIIQDQQQFSSSDTL